MQTVSATSPSIFHYPDFRHGICPIPVPVSSAAIASAEPVSADTVCLHHVEIVPEYRNRGYGTAFLLLLLPALSKEGFQKAVLQVSGDNAAAIALYKKTGFSVTKTLSYYFY